MNMSLVVADGVHSGKEIPVSKFPFLMGRSRTCNLRPASEMVSKQHCALLTRAGKVYVHDFNSRNGTFVNNARVARPTELHDGDQLKVGPLQFTVRLEALVPVNQPTPIPEAASGESSDDEIAAMLLEMDAQESEEADQHQTTTVELPLPPAVADGPEPPALVPRPAAPPKPAVSSSEAAQKLLSRMNRRDRK